MAKAIQKKLQARETQNAAPDTPTNTSAEESGEDASESGKGAAEMAYLKMPAWKYYTLTLSLYIGCILGSIYIDDIAAVFEFVGAFGLSLTSFTLPGIMYLLMQCNPNANHAIETDR